MKTNILLATHNGASWLDAQLESIAAQRDVQISLVASDDASTDDTREILAKWATRLPMMLLPFLPERMGSAHKNFLRLIHDADPADADFFAFADQDDIWLPTKLARAIACLKMQDADGYSGNVIAFWPNGRRILIDKAQPQRRFDYLFSAPGPGCTFVLPRKVFLHLQAFVRQNYAQLQTLWIHDWLIYAFVRSGGGRWYIDPEAHVLYRQHDSNAMGANVGWRAARMRLARIRTGAFRRDILAIADAVGEQGWVVEALRRFGWLDRVRLTLGVNQFRRRFHERLLLAVSFWLMPRYL